MESSSGKVRLEFKGRIEDNRMEYQKAAKEIENFDIIYKNELLKYNSNTNSNNSRVDNLTNTMVNNTNNLIDSNRTANEIIDRDKATAQELRRQGNQLLSIHEKISTSESNLTLVQQITDVMKRNDLYYKFKLYIVIILLFVADLIVLYIKLK